MHIEQADTESKTVLEGFSVDALIDEIAHRVILRIDELRRFPPGEEVDERAIDLALDQIRRAGFNGSGEIYVIRPKGLDALKIGYAERTKTERRLATLQTAWPIPLEIVGKIPWVTLDTERGVQSALGDHRINLEWFKYNRTTAAFIERCHELETSRNRSMLAKARIQMAAPLPSSSAVPSSPDGQPGENNAP